MKATNKIILAVTLGAVAGVAIYAWRRHQSGRILKEVADEGYETAHDILYPDRKHRGRRLKYGMVHPD